MRLSVSPSPRYSSSSSRLALTNGTTASESMTPRRRLRRAPVGRGHRRSRAQSRGRRSRARGALADRSSERCAQIATISVAVLAQARVARPDRVRRRRPAVAERRGLAMRTAARDVHRRLAVERRPARQHFVEHDAKRKDIRARIHESGLAPVRGTCRPRCRESGPSGSRTRRSHPRFAAGLSETSLARPKSRTFTSPSRRIITFSGLMSRWTMPGRGGLEPPCRPGRTIDSERSRQRAGRSRARAASRRR